MRTFTEILDAIRADWVASFVLQDTYGIDPEKSFEEQFSAVSVEALMTYIFASAVYLHELVVNAKANEMEAKIANEYPFTKEWYRNKAIAFQLGDLIVFDETSQKFQYATTDENKQIVEYVAIRERQISGVTKLQVYAAKEDKAALTVSELSAFSAYLQEIGAAGTHFQFISLAPDQLTINLTVTYNAQLIDGNGNALADGTKPVDLAIAAYLDGIKYSGMFNRTRCIDAVQQASGVLDAVLADVYMNGDLNNTQSFESPSGFFQAATINVTYTAGNSDDY